MQQPFAHLRRVADRAVRIRRHVEDQRHELVHRPSTGGRRALHPIDQVILCSPTHLSHAFMIATKLATRSPFGWASGRIAGDERDELHVAGSRRDPVAAYRWAGDSPPTAIVQIAHGMGEHAARYRRLGEALTAAGYVGLRQRPPRPRARLRRRQSSSAISDLVVAGPRRRSRHARRPRPKRAPWRSARPPRSQHGLVRSAELPPRSQRRVDAAVLSGTSAVDLIAAGIDPTQEVDLSAFNAAFEPARTESDWLSRDEAEVDTYLADPWCGFGIDAAAPASMLIEAPATADPAKLAAIRRRSRSTSSPATPIRSPAGARWSSSSPGATARPESPTSPSAVSGAPRGVQRDQPRRDHRRAARLDRPSPPG